MTLGASILLIAVGAILRYATSFKLAGLDIETVGFLILMIAGAAGLILGLILMLSANRRPADREVYVEKRRDLPPR